MIILDGVGINPNTEHNAVAMAHTPTIDRLLRDFPHGKLLTSGESVGLPMGVMGNSEVGHLALGSGRVILQDLTRISHFSKSKGFDSLPDLKRVLTQEGVLHLIGLVSDGCVHSDIDHLIDLIALARKYPAKTLSLHLITDGRDTAPKSAMRFIERIEAVCSGLTNVRVSTVMGRFFAMDRDKRWERTEQAYRALISQGADFSALSSRQALEEAYRRGETDEFISPTILEGGLFFRPEDQVLFFNFRADRARQLSMACGATDFNFFATPIKIAPENWLCMTEYNKNFEFPVLFQREKHIGILGETLSNLGLAQLRAAETEKYAHVTYYFNGGREEPFLGEDRALIPSDKKVSTYDQNPAMSAFEVTEAVLNGLRAEKYQFILVNYANGDMVGHTGNETAAVNAVEMLDQCLTKILSETMVRGYETIITADHGNCEMMVDPNTGDPFTQHTTFPVNIIWVGPRAQQAGSQVADGTLADVAPSVLALMGIAAPAQMTGHNLLQESPVR